ncbi:MAG: HAL/PAL/TAL family ammonia-lyase, partial [bacterium]
LEPLTLGPKEGLALLNGTQLMSAIGALLLADADRLGRTASVVAAMSVEALLGTDVAFAAAYQLARPHPGQIEVATELRHLLRESGLQRAHHASAHKVQDPYSLRCIPQVHGASRDAIAYAWRVIEIEINSATDNPLIFPDDDRVISGGNFHGQPVALALDLLAIAVSELANIAERRIERLVNPHLSGLPAFLTNDSGLHSGLMLAQYTAAALVSENKVLSHPASVDSIPTSANQEDHVSMGAIAARKAARVLAHAQQVIGIELICAAQALDFHRPLRPGKGTGRAYDAVRQSILPLKADRVLADDLAKGLELVRDGSVLAAAEQLVGRLS